MPALLLISPENGGQLKPYGLKGRQLCMMKIALICVGIVLFCCENAVADREFYPGLKYDPIEGSPHLQSLDESTYYDTLYKDKSLPLFPVEDIVGGDRRESAYDLGTENLLSMLKTTRKKLNTRHHSDKYEKALEVLERLEDRYKQMKDSTDRINMLDQYLFNSINTPRLEEARMYPHEDDFMFNEDRDGKFYRNGETVQDEDFRNDAIGTKIEFETSKTSPASSHHGMHHGHGHEDYVFKKDEEFPDASLKDIPVVEDPSEFGYGPSDPRFFQQNDQTSSESITAKAYHMQYLQPLKITSKLKIKARSDPQRSPLDLEQIEENFTGKNKLGGTTEVEVVAVKPEAPSASDTTGMYIIAVVAGISAAATVGLIAVGIGWYNLQKHMKNAEESDYPSYGIVGPNKDYEKRDRDEAGDRRLAQSAQMYHYQHQKQQIIAMGRHPQGGHGSISDTDEEEDEEGNYTVYECPGLASIEGPLEVKNPMFDDNQLATPSQTPSKSTNANDTK